MQTRIVAPKRSEMERPDGIVESCATSELRVTSRHGMLRKTGMYVVGRGGMMPAAYSAVRSSTLVAGNDYDGVLQNAESLCRAYKHL